MWAGINVRSFFSSNAIDILGAQRLRTIFSTITFLVIAFLGSASCSPSTRIRSTAITAYIQCDSPGRTCCDPDAEVKTKHCHHGLGCNIATGKCAPCGAAGTPCCDGDFTGFSLKGYTGLLLDPSERIESCDTDTSCDASLAPDGVTWLGSRLCRLCGTEQGGHCCAPDVRYAIGRCFSDSVTGRRLVCNNGWSGADGICVRCGEKIGEPACLMGFPCDDGMVEKNGVCVACGFAGQPTCDRGDPCRNELYVPDRSYSMCVQGGGPNQPCLPDRQAGPCTYAGLFCSSKKICEPCGGGGERCCPPPVTPACRDRADCRDGRCFACGFINMPVCAGNICHSGEPNQGFCRHCGDDGERCCYDINVRCNTGMRCEDRTCHRQGGSGGTGQQSKTCSRQPYTWSTIPRPVAIEDADGCIVTVNFIASTPEEAIQCARVQYGESVITGGIQDFPFAVICPSTGCNQRTYPGKDHDSAEKCATSTSVGCTVQDGSCP